MELAPGAEGEPHTVDREEVFVLASGVVSATVGGQDHTLDEQDALIVPPDTEFALRNPGSAPAQLTVCTTAGIQARLAGRTVTRPWSV